MKLFVRIALVLVLAVSAVPMAAPKLLGYKSDAPAALAADRELPKANYDLASRWMAAKVGKYVFSTSVTPHWLEFSDRFWYDYETPAGRKWWVVDPVKKTKTPLFDNAKIAAQLTRILRTPYDASICRSRPSASSRTTPRSASASRCRVTRRWKTPPARKSPA